MEEQKKSSAQKIQMVARIISVPIILAALAIAIGNIFDWITGTTDPNVVTDYPFIENVPPFLISLAAIGLVVAFFRERVGAWINIALCAATLIVIPFTFSDPSSIHEWIPILVIIVALPGVLFLMHDRKIHSVESRKKLENNNSDEERK